MQSSVKSSAGGKRKRESLLLCRAAVRQRPRGEITSVTDGSCRRFKWRVIHNKWICRISARGRHLRNGPLVRLLAGSLNLCGSWAVCADSEPCLESVHAAVWRVFSADDLQPLSALELLMRRVE